MARPTKPFYAPWLGKHITGLCHLPDGRWRIGATGERFREADERLAVERYQRAIGTDDTLKTVVVGEVVGQASGSKNQWDSAAMERAITAAAAMGQRAGWAIGRTSEAGTELVAGIPMPEDLLWRWIAKQIHDDPQRCAAKTGIFALATLDPASKPATPVKLAAILDAYMKHSPAKTRVKGQMRAAFVRLRKITGAETVADLTSATLIAFRGKLMADLAPAWASQIFKKIKAAFAFAVKWGLDADQVAPALARLKVLYAPGSQTPAKPQPIAREDFQKLLAAANGEWRAILLLSLNMSLYLEDVCEMRWADFDLVSGTYAGRRGKTGIARVGWLWPETIAALKALPHKGQSPLLFTARSGLRFGSSARHNAFKTLRERAGVTAPFSSLRDGSYTHAARGCDEKTAKLFAAHKFSGVMDRYVLRRPDLVRPAALAVRQAYL